MSFRSPIDLDTSLGFHTNYYIRNQHNQSRIEINEQTLESNIYLFLSFVHQNKGLSDIFKSICYNKDKFLHFFDLQQYQTLLHQLLQVFNIFFIDFCKSHELSPKYDFTKQYEFKQNNTKKLQRSIKEIIQRDLDPLKNQIEKSRMQAKQVSSELKTSKSSVLIPCNSNKSFTRAGVEELKLKIQNLALQHEISLQCRRIKTEKSAKTEKPFINVVEMYDKINQTSAHEELKRSNSDKKISNNRISFGNQAFIHHLPADKIQQIQQQQCLQFQASPTFQEKKLDIQLQSDSELELQDQLLPETIKPFRENTFGKHYSSTKKKKSNPQLEISSSTPKSSIKQVERANFDVRYLSIDQMDKKKKTIGSSRDFNIVTNESNNIKQQS